MIKNIKLNNCTPYQRAELTDCKKVNFIFGANGSGKSTISSFLAGVDDTRFSSSSLEWTGETHEKIEVYNKGFRIANLQEEMPGIFTLGSATIDDIKALELLKSDLEQLTKEWEGLCTSYRNKESEKPVREAQFKEDAWTQILKKNETDFQKAFEGLRNSKERFLAELKRRITGIPGHEGTICKRVELLQRAQTLYASRPEKRSKFVLDIDKLLKNIEDVHNDAIWNTVIAGSRDVDIAALITELGNSSWVGQGRQYLRADSKKCPFCQQETIDDDFREKLEAFFDTAYKQKTDRLAMLLVEYQSFSKQILDAIEDAVIDKDESVKTGQLNAEVYKAKKDLLKAAFDANAKKIEEKIAEPGKKITLEDISNLTSEIRKLLDDANALIDAHNQLVAERDTEEIALRDDIWATCIHDADGLIKAYQRDFSNIEKALNGIKKNRDTKKTALDKLKAEVEEKGKNITSVQPTIDEINRSLKAYGFTNFSIQPAEGKENYYCIKRDDGSLATNTLSEGEETFLTFLYFMQKAKGSTDQARVADKKIIVLDDPISSLDSTILYIVGAIVKDLSKKIRDEVGDVTQLFILTHNVFFHKEASFIDGRTHELKDVNYWIVRKNNGVAEINAYGMKNPISTSYELLWQELKDNTGASLISIQNTMRRIIENYFSMLGGRRDDLLVEKFESTEDKMIARSLLYWINDGSHSIPDDLFIDPYTDAVPRYKNVFRDIFDKSGHLPHYNMMMKIEDETETMASEVPED
jgi:wobble nucleotide-excising tRNase